VGEKNTHKIIALTAFIFLLKNQADLLRPPAPLEIQKDVVISIRETEKLSEKVMDFSGVYQMRIQGSLVVISGSGTSVITEVQFPIVPDFGA